MKVRFAADVLDLPDAWKALDMIVYEHFTKGRHQWDVPDPKAVEKSRWFVDNSNSHWTKTNAELLKKSVVKSTYKTNAHTLVLTVSAAPAPPMTLQPADAKDALDLPAHIVVEDGESDKAFLDALIRAFARTTLRNARENEWCVIVHAGGCGQIIKRVKELVPKTKKGPRRILVLADSDRLIPDALAKTPIKTDPMNVLKECRNEYRVETILLNKREIENYLPIEALEGWAREKKHVLEAFKELSPAQRDHYDMKKGFSDEDGNFVIPAEQQPFYEDLDKAILAALHTGFGDRVWTLFTETSYVINKTNLCESCPDEPDELERILDAIESLL